MRSAVVQILPIFVILLVSACKSPELKQVENIMISNPDSALTILEEIKPGYNDMSDRDKALFGVLYFQALNKNLLDLSPQEMIDFSLDYFLRKKDKYYLSYAQFYKARFLRENEQHGNAVTLLLEALELAKITGDESLMAKIYSDLGNIAFRQVEFNKSKDYYQKSADIFMNMNELNNHARSLVGLGRVCNRLKDYAEAFDNYQKALIISTDSLTIGIALYEIGNNYFERLEYDSAIHYINRSVEYPSIGVNKFLTYLTLAQLYFDIKHKDLAVEYANLALTFPTDFYIQRENYAVLANVAYINNNQEETSLYLNKYMACQDSIIKLE